MIRDRGVRIAARLAGPSDIFDGRTAVAPLGVHLEIAGVIIERWSITRTIVKDSQDFGPAQEMRAQRATTLDVVATATRVNRTFNGRGSASLERLLNDSRRPWADAGDLWQPALRRDEFRQGRVESQNSGGRPLVAEHLWLRCLREREVAQQSAGDRVDIGERRHRRRSPTLIALTPDGSAFRRTALRRSRAHSVRLVFVGSSGCAASAAR